MAIYHNGIKISSLFHNGEHINKIFHNGKCIYAPIAVGESLYNGIPSKGIMLYGSLNRSSSSNPLGIKGDSINLKASLSSCPNGIKIHFSNYSYYNNGLALYDTCSIPDISIPKGSSSGSSKVSSFLCDGSIKASIKESALSFSVTNSDERNKVYTGTVADITSDNEEILAITSITAY